MKFKKLLTIITGAALLLSSVGTVFAREKADRNWEMRRAFIEKNMIELGKQGPEKVDAVSIAMAQTNWDAVTGYTLPTNPT